MPLSEHEQKMLDEMERQLFADDPRLARAFRGADRPKRSHRRIVLGLVGVLLGLGLLVLAVALPAIWLGVLAFLLMLVSALYAATGPSGDSGSTEAGTRAAGSASVQGSARRARGGATAPGAAPRGDDASRSDFMRRMEQRWERRSDPDSSR